ncbi:MAG: low molecular weight protein arginine phosphatase [Syntrophomonadaceae bacterium]|nr:low molecular weight protein arginine phosphatase [Syntrophomonadaceae bacterium]
MKRVLFVCTGNTCRSPMAKALLEKLIKQKSKQDFYEVDSAGLFAVDGLSASSEAIAVLRYENYDLGFHQSKSINEQIINWADIIITMTEAHYEQLLGLYPAAKNRVFSFSELADLPESDVTDPYGQGQEAYQITLQQLKQGMPRLFTYLENMR